jgi:hypothetical protein
MYFLFLVAISTPDGKEGVFLNSSGEGEERPELCHSAHF